MGENKTNWWKVGGLIAIAAAIFVSGFFIGKSREPEVVVKEKIEYKELPPVHDTLYNPVPVYVKKPVDSLNVLLSLIRSGKYNELFPERVRDTIIYVSSSDTAEVIRDWATERLYSGTVFDVDTLGKLDISAAVQYNRLQDVGYEFVPIQKEMDITIRSPRTFLPYLGAGVDTGGSLIGQGGVFIKQDAGVAVQYRYDMKRKENSVGLMFLYMF